MPQATQSNTTPTTAVRATFSDRMVELTIGIDLLIAHLDKVFNAGFELDLEMGRDVMDACIAAQWIANRLSEDIHTVGCEFVRTTPSLVLSNSLKRPNSHHQARPSNGAGSLPRERWRTDLPHDANEKIALSPMEAAYLCCRCHSATSYRCAQPGHKT